MKKIGLSFLLPGVALLFAGCPGGLGGGKTAAVVNGKSITVEELDQAFGGKIAQQIYEMRRETLDDLISEQLIEQAAKEKKTTPEELIKTQTEGLVEEPTETEIKAIYEANKDRFDGPFEEVRGQITGILKHNRKMGARNQYLAELREKAKMDIKLEKPPVKKVEVSVDDDPSQGPDNAKVVIVEFSDYQCPYCGRARGTVNRILDTYKDKIKYAFRDFPLSFHREAFAAHVAAQCANDQKKYWEYNKILFENQQTLKPENLKQYAVQLGLNTHEFNQCLDNNKYESEVQKDQADGIKAGVSGTPSFFINGVMLSGAQSFENFKELIDEALKK